jgi:hypothetical protein
VTPATHPGDGAVIPRRRAFAGLAWQVLALLAVALLTWLALRGYQDPAFMLELANWQLC